MGAIRTRVLRRFVRQRPDVEGPVRRELFSLAEHETVRSVTVATVGEQVRLSVGRLSGASIGDVYGVVPADAAIHDDAPPLAELEITEVFAATANARWTTSAGAIPVHTVVVPIRRSVPRWPVAIDAPPEVRAAVESAIAASRTLRMALHGEAGSLATLRVADGAVTIDDAGGPLFPPAPFPAGLDRMVAHLANHGVAQGVRELEGEHGVLASELAIELGIIVDGRRCPLPDHGSVLSVRDKYYVNLEHRGQRPLFVHLLAINARGRILLLNHFARGGLVLDRHHPPVMIGQRADGAVIGVGLRWPDGLPRGELPRITELVVIATPTITDLSGLETREIVVTRSDGSQLLRQLAQLCDGAYRGGSRAGALDGFLVKRLSILLAPPRSDEPSTEGPA